jgi:hypothetical protein
MTTGFYRRERRDRAEDAEENRIIVLSYGTTGFTAENAEITPRKKRDRIC